jgi:hypothetical protein
MRPRARGPARPSRIDPPDARPPDLATLACLQNRLNELDENLAIEIREW